MEILYVGKEWNYWSHPFINCYYMVVVISLGDTLSSVQGFLLNLLSRFTAGISIGRYKIPESNQGQLLKKSFL